MCGFMDRWLVDGSSDVKLDGWMAEGVREGTRTD